MKEISLYKLVVCPLKMRSIGLCLLILLMSGCSTNLDPSVIHGKYFGTYIQNSPRHGRPYLDKSGLSRGFFSISTVIINDSILPVHLNLSFENEYYCHGRKFYVFFMPEEMTVEKQVSINYFRDSVQKYLDTTYYKPTRIDRIIKSRENYTINVGFISEPNSNFVPTRLALMSKGHKHHFTSVPDSMVILDGPEANMLPLSFGLNFAIPHDTGCTLIAIPCGKLIYETSK